MRLLRTTHTVAFAFLLLTLISGCAKRLNIQSSLTHNDPPFAYHTQQPATATLYFFREANYRGAGRVHLLTLDGNEVGQISSDNYYRVELWPGHYHLSVYLPVENFLGSVSPPSHTSMQVVIQPDSVPGNRIYKYTDGKGIYQATQTDPLAISQLTKQRVLSGSLSARETAQVKYLYDARYDGPAMADKAHGMGTLTWKDGSMFSGRFNYGHATKEGLFFIPGGPIYMGPKRRGRPIGPGVWMTPTRDIIFAGNFTEEVPHGVGARTGPAGPEFCEYDKGEDITRTLRQIVLKAIEIEDQRIAGQTADEPLSAEELTSTEILRKEVLEKQSSKAVMETTNPVNKNTELLTATPLEKIDSHLTDKNFRMQPRPEPTEPSPYLRMLAKQKEIESKIRNQIKEKQDWCNEEFLLGRRLCVCAPFANDFKDWNSCGNR